MDLRTTRNPLLKTIALNIPNIVLTAKFAHLDDRIDRQTIVGCGIREKGSEQMVVVESQIMTEDMNEPTATNRNVVIMNLRR
jgi:hypothetical protein